MKARRWETVARVPLALPSTVALAASLGLWTPEAHAQSATPAPASLPAASAAPAAAPASAEACATPSPTDVEAAKNAYRSGQTAFSEGDYERAVVLWTDAYSHDCTAHALLLNLATAQELSGHPERAIEALQRFDERLPGSPYVAANTKRISRLQKVPAVRPRARPEPPPPPCPAPATLRTSDASEVTIPIALAVGGGALALTGGILYAEARAAESSAAHRCSSGANQCSNVGDVVDGERARSRAQTAGWLTGAGLVTLTTGLVWHFLIPSKSSELSSGASLQTDADISPGALRMSVSGRF
ncbi:MAG TPA: tetratricopeptide repeat protein [Polyangiaceae bacterium]|nr:tetratricopeptide repeat protein [Polyangiaceae bacterium]